MGVSGHIHATAALPVWKVLDGPLIRYWHGGEDREIATAENQTSVV
jgi:hypothetical protein